MDSGRRAPTLTVGHSLVLLAQQQADVVELGPLRGLLGPAALHQLTQLLAVTLGVDGWSEAGPLPQDHPVHDLCREGRGSVSLPSCVFTVSCTAGSHQGER